MNQTKKEKKVKELYTKYPYPNREIKNEKKLENYVIWLGKILDKKTSFWKDKNILELGCGTGELANGLGLCGGKIYAIDFSKNSIKKANELKKRFKNKNVSFFEKNILEFENKKKFDVVIALGSLHHTINARQGFEIACNHCKKNGLVIIGVYNKYSRFRHRIKRIILFLLARNNIEKRIFWGEKLFGGIKNNSWLGDKYGQVHESYHSINEILKWFKEENIIFVASKPKFKIPILDELKWFLKKESAFFVMVGIKE